MPNLLKTARARQGVHFSLKTSYAEDDLVCCSIFSIVRVFLAFKNLHVNFKFSFAPRFFVAPKLSGPYGEKQDRSSANQITGFRGKPDRKKINISYLPFRGSVLKNIFQCGIVHIRFQ